jgi:hypothetical protein
MKNARPQSFSALWVEGRLGPYERLALSTFVAAGCSVVLYTYDMGLEVPTGVCRRDAGAIVPDSRRQTFPGGATHFSNLFRYRLLREQSTIWIDVDLLLVDLNAIPDQDHLYGVQTDGQINTALLALPMDSPALDALIERCDIVDGTRLHWGLLGPELLTTMLTSFGLEERALPPRTAYPIGWQDAWRLFDPDELEWCQQKVEGAATLHLWNQFLTKDGLKRFAPASRSFLDLLAAERSVAFNLPEVPRALLDEVRRKRAERYRRRPSLRDLLLAFRTVPTMLAARARL